ncbi:hypothetical protein ASE94_13060 [Devosia sp. Leaf64]|nr:hypothetical protein ASE94_13060 [Devosia sp. Leaf64]
MRHLKSLAWLAATAVAATIQTVFFAVAANDMASSIAISMLTPAAYLAFGQCIREALGQKDQHWRLYAVVAVLTCLGVALRLADVPFVYRTSIFQASCALALGDCLFRLWKYKGRGAAEYALCVVVGGTAAMFVYRFFAYPIMFSVGTKYVTISASDHERTTLTVSAILSVAALFLALARIINGVIYDYRRLSEMDSLTGLLNHQAFHRLASPAGKTGGSVIFCDIDHFKSINDRFGHLAGDKALRAFADLLKASGFAAGRLGGEEFALILPDLAPEVAAIEAERLRMKYAGMRHSALAEDARVTASFGIAGYEPGEEPRRAFSRADAALYAAKSSGRNRVALHVEEETAASAAA